MKIKGMMKKGFTLIEVMVVLSVLAIIAILAYNFFGGTMKEATVTQAAAKIADDMRVLDDGWNKYYIDNSAEPANIAALVTAGTLKAVPSPPSNGVAEAATVYVAADAVHTMSGTTSNDTLIYLDGVTADVCTEVNERYTDLGATVPDYTTATFNALNTNTGPRKNIMCFRNITAAETGDGLDLGINEYVVVKIAMVN